MENFSTYVGEKFAKNTLKIYFEESVADKITNNDYEGEIKGGGADRLNVLTFGALTLQDYDGSDLSAETPQESEGTLIVNQKKAYYFKVLSWDSFKSYVEDPSSTLISNAGKQLKEEIDSYVLGLYGDVAAGQHIGTDYTTGTVAIAADGTVTGTGTVFTAAMVGKSFKASGHSKWYRVKSRASDTEIVIELDLDDEATTYDGGVIAAGTSYTIQAVTAVQVTAANIYAKLVALRKYLNKAKVPKTDRWIVLPSDISSIIMQASQFIPAIESAHNEVVKRGLLGQILGFTIYENEQVAGNETDGFYVIAGHRSWCTFAMAFVKTQIEEDIKGNFGSAYKGLNCYGGKVIDERRKCAALLFCKE